MKDSNHLALTDSDVEFLLACGISARRSLHDGWHDSLKEDQDLRMLDLHLTAMTSTPVDQDGKRVGALEDLTSWLMFATGTSPEVQR